LGGILKNEVMDGFRVTPITALKILREATIVSKSNAVVDSAGESSLEVERCVGRGRSNTKTGVVSVVRTLNEDPKRGCEILQIPFYLVEELL
jgi:hypothetical protein